MQPTTLRQLSDQQNYSPVFFNPTPLLDLIFLLPCISPGLLLKTTLACFLGNSPTDLSHRSIHRGPYNGSDSRN